MTARLSRLHPCLLLLGLILSALPATQSADAEKVRPYLLARCMISGQKLGADAVTFTYEGKEIMTCCDQCMEDFYKDPMTYLDKIEQAEKKIEKKKREKLLCLEQDKAHPALPCCPTQGAQRMRGTFRQKAAL